jgi:MoxR-like ATPase
LPTQNPSSQIGTFPLPESQLDRFLLRIDLGYPDHDAERSLLESGGRREQLPTLAARLGAGEFALLQRQAAAVHVSPALLDYLQLLVEATRKEQRFVHGLSPRAALSLLAAARAWAFTGGRAMVLPEDVQAVLPAVARHRLRLVSGSHADAEDIALLIRSVPLA